MKNPLRKVIGSTWVTIGDSGLYEKEVMVLECGHHIPYPADIYGRYYPQRRRCYKCRLGLPQDEQG